MKTSGLHSQEDLTSFKEREKKVLLVVHMVALLNFTFHVIAGFSSVIITFEFIRPIIYLVLTMQTLYLVFTIISIRLKKRNYFLSKMIIMVTLTVCMLENALIYGNESAINITTVAVILVSFLLFDRYEYKYLYFFVLMNFVNLIITEVISYYFLNDIHLYLFLTPLSVFRESYGFFYWFNFSASSLAILAVLRLYLKETISLFDKVLSANDRINTLLHNVFPGKVVESLYSRQVDQVLSWDHPEAIVFFADLCHFTKSVKNMEPDKLIKELNSIYKMIDDLTEKYEITKIKTIGDGYLAVCGAPEEKSEAFQKIMSFATEVLQSIESYKPKSEIEGLDIRIGIDSGRVISGVIGQTRQTYDIWGNTVNKASRLESTSEPGRIHVSQSVYGRIRERFQFMERDTILKGFGLEKTYILIKELKSII